MGNVQINDAPNNHGEFGTNSRYDRRGDPIGHTKNGVNNTRTGEGISRERRLRYAL